MIEDQKDGEPVTPRMDVYKAKIQSDGSLDKLKLIIVVRGDLQNKEMVGDTWSPTASMRTLKYFLADATKHKARVHQLQTLINGKHVLKYVIALSKRNWNGKER